MKDYEYEVELIETIPEEITLKAKGKLITKGEWYGHSFGDAVGRIYDDGRVESFFKHDDPGNEWFDMLKKKGVLRTRHRNLIDRMTYKEYSCDEFYLMRRVNGHVSGLPTVMDDCLDTCMNVDYKYTYEILLVADDEYKRYVTKEIRTSGPHTFCLIDEIGNLEGQIEEWAEEKKNGFSYDEDNTLCCKMYNDFGEETDADFYSTRELLMCINSIRLVKLKQTIVDR